MLELKKKIIKQFPLKKAIKNMKMKIIAEFKKNS